MKNYIEIVHEYDDSDTEWHSESRDIWYAVRPTTPSYRQWKQGEPEEDWSDHSLLHTSWSINGDISIYGKEDIAGLRKLLDAIEAQYEEEK